MTDPKFNSIIIDDSPLQRLYIGKFVDNHPSLTLTGAFGNAFQAKNYLKDHSVDLIFLDVEMPVFSGFDLLDELEEHPKIIVITGRTQHAFKAFSYQAVDFLQKPLDKTRFDLAIEKAIAQGLSNGKSGKSARGSFIFIKSKLKKYKVYIDDIRYVEAKGDYVKVVTYEDDFEVLSTMKAFNKELPENQFLRVHKSYMINLSKVENYGSKTIQLEDLEIPLSRHRKEDLKNALEKMHV